MTRENLENIPEFLLPEGFSLRWYGTGDEELWTQIQLATERYRQITPGFFRQQFGTDDRILTLRQCFLFDEKEKPVGTGTAWFENEFRARKYGRVHWMAILPEYQGRGLGKALMTIVCRRLKDLGHDRAFLRTSTARAAAIHLYQRFGFDVAERQQP